MNIDIQPTVLQDVPALQRLVDETGLFPSGLLPDMVAGFLGDDPQDIWLTCHLDGTPVGFCYAVPEQMTAGTWNMLALAVLPVHQGQGLGARLVARLETLLEARGQRILIVDTSGTGEFALTRRFYAKNGYDEEARIRDFWADGDDKVTFRKALS